MTIWCFLTLIPDMSCLCKQCRSRSVDQVNWSGSAHPINWSGSARFVIKFVNLYQQHGSSNLIGWKLEMGMASRPPPRGRFGRSSRRNSYDFALSVREGEDDFAPFFGDFRNLLSVLLAPVSRFFACLQQTLTVALMIANGDTPTTTRCLQKHDIITLIGNYP